MKFDFWTFAFQIINFAVLLFILRRLLFKPVREIMEKRRARAAAAMEEAETARKEAEALRETHQAELEDFRRQRTQRLEDLKAEVAEERGKRMDEAIQGVESAIAKERALFEADKKHCAAEMKTLALESVETFAANLLRDLADEPLHRALCRKCLSEVDGIVDVLRGARPETETLRVEVSSAYPLVDEEISSLRKALSEGLGKPVELTIDIDEELLAGVKLRADDLLFDASLRGQVSTLAERLRKNA